MKQLVLACCLFLVSLAVRAQALDESALKQQVNAFVDEWHDDAAHARLAYFDKMAKDAVYIGTDKTELWHRDEFKAWAKRFFERKSAWAFKPIRRNVYASADQSTIWFDELLDTQMGVCMASGVIRKGANGLEIMHYQLSMAVPNEVGGQVTGLIRQFEAKQPAK
jgi:hypothetical protein